MTSSIAAIHVAKKSLGLDEDTYRAKLQNIPADQWMTVMNRLGERVRAGKAGA